MLRKFSCIEACSDCCIYREYYPSIEYGKTGVLILPKERSKIKDQIKITGIEVKILPRLGIGKNRKGDGPKRILAYQMMGKNADGNLCPFLEIDNPQKSPHGGFKCKIYEKRPLACHAYPVLQAKDKTVELDGKCQFYQKFSSPYDRDTLRDEIEALTKIEAEFFVDEKIEVWRYATAVGDEKIKHKLLPEGWVPQYM
jgi:Fe-S-cluster containining protein